MGWPKRYLLGDFVEPTDFALNMQTLVLQNYKVNHITHLCQSCHLLMRQKFF
jgi:hypothetical protein